MPSGVGVLEPLQVLPSTPTDFTGDDTGAEIVVAPSGRSYTALTAATTASVSSPWTGTRACLPPSAGCRRGARCPVTSISILPDDSFMLAIRTATLSSG